MSKPFDVNGAEFVCGGEPLRILSGALHYFRIVPGYWEVTMKNEGTYNGKNTGHIVETYEWDSTWCEQACDTETQRVLYIGDSISCGVRQFATVASKNQLLFDGFGTSKALDNPFYTEMLHLFARQQRYRSLVLFNNGLHGWHLDDETLYPEYFRKMLVFLKEEFPGIPVAVVLSTAVSDCEKRARVIKRNTMARRLAMENNCQIIDLFSVSEQYAELHTDDGIHFTGEGYRQLAATLYKSADAILAKPCQ